MSTPATKQSDELRDGAAPGTVCAAFQATAARHPDRVALRTKGDAVSLTYRELAERVRRVALGLHALGLRRGDRLALMLSNRPEFHVLDAAALHLGAVPFSIYNTAAPEQIAYQLQDAEPRIAVVEAEYRDRVAVERVLTPDDLPGLEAGGGEAELDFDAAWRAVEPDDVLTLIYTSGTTGPPKGVQITHRNEVFTANSYDAVIGFPDGAAVVSYLPMAHIAERNCSHYWAMMFGFTVTCCPNARELFDYLREVRPAWFFAVPRIFEKLRAAIESGADDELREAIARGLARVRGETTEAPDEQRLAAVRAEVGLERIVSMNIGGVPTPAENIEFFHALGLPLGELWGMSETTGIGTCNGPENTRIGTVGPPVPGVGLRVADDGEVELRGECVFAGYWKQPEKTAEAFTPDGWLLTGDVGRLDEAGYLVLVDRKKELIINAAGKNMSPANIESELKAASPLIASAVVIGDGRPYNVALLVLDPDVAAGTAGSREHSVEDLAREPAVLEAVEAAVEQANARLARVEQIRRYHVLATEWEPGGEVLTPTSKIKRRVVAERYAEEIDALYASSSSG